MAPFRPTGIAPPLPSPEFEVPPAWHARTDADPAHVWSRESVTESVAGPRAPPPTAAASR